MLGDNAHNLIVTEFCLPVAASAGDSQVSILPGVFATPSCPVSVKPTLPIPTLFFLCLRQGLSLAGFCHVVYSMPSGPQTSGRLSCQKLPSSLRHYSCVPPCLAFHVGSGDPHLSSWACKTSAFLYPQTISAALDSGSDVMRAYQSLGYGLDRDWLGGGGGRGFLNIPGPPCPCALRGTVTKAVYRRSLFGLWFQAHKSPWWCSKGGRWQVAGG